MESSEGGRSKLLKTMSFKEKIDFIRAAVPGAKKKDVVTILQSCDYHVDEAIATLTEDGGRRVLDQWSTTPQRWKKPKRSFGKQVPKKDEGASSASDVKPSEITDGPPANEKETNKSETKSVPPVPVPAAVAMVKRAAENDPTHQSSRFRCDSISSDVSTASTGSGMAGGNFRKQVKEFHRASTQLPRFELMLNESLNVCEKRVKSSMSEFRKILEEREAELASKLASIRTKATSLLQGRIEHAEKLRVQADSLATLSPAQANEIKEDIKHFLSERRIDEELASLEWFSGQTDELSQSLKEFGKVAEIRHLYSERKKSGGSRGRDESQASKSHGSKKETRPAAVSTPEPTVASRDVSQAPKSHGSKKETRPAAVSTPTATVAAAAAAATATAAVAKENHHVVSDLSIQAELHNKLKSVVTMQENFTKGGVGKGSSAAAKEPQHKREQQRRHDKKRDKDHHGAPSSRQPPPAQKSLPNDVSSSKKETPPESSSSPSLATLANGKESSSPLKSADDEPLPQREKRRRKREKRPSSKPTSDPSNPPPAAP